MLDAPPNRKATFPATAKAWPCLWQKTWTIRWGLSIYQWATTKQINISSSFILTSLHLKIWMSGSGLSCRGDESTVLDRHLSYTLLRYKNVTHLGLGASPLISFSSQWPLANAIFTPAVSLSLSKTHTQTHTRFYHLSCSGIWLIGITAYSTGEVLFLVHSLGLSFSHPNV